MSFSVVTGHVFHLCITATVCIIVLMVLMKTLVCQVQ